MAVLTAGPVRGKYLYEKSGAVRRAKTTRVAKEPNNLPRKATIA